MTVFLTTIISPLIYVDTYFLFITSIVTSSHTHTHTPTHTHPLHTGPTDQPNVIPSLPALNRSFVLPINSSLIVIELTLVDDDVSLEPNERVQYRLVLPGGSMGVELGNPNVTYVNIIDDDGTNYINIFTYECAFKSIIIIIKRTF